MPAWAYVDTSIVLKRYLDEQHTPQARALLRRYRILTSAVTPVEAVSALYRRAPTGDIAPGDLRAILRQLERDQAAWTVVEVSAEVLRRAGEVIARTRVCTLDAIHLGSALVAGADRAGPAFLTADVRQREAAEALGLGVVRVG